MSSAERPSPHPPHPVVYPPAAAGGVEPVRLLALVRRVAAGDGDAFADLHDTLLAGVQAAIRTTLSDPATVAAVATATFVEAWWLARFHTGPDTDVRAWIEGIAARRAGERHRSANGRGADAAADGHGVRTPRRRWWRAVAAYHDRPAEQILAALLGPAHSAA